MQPIQSITIPEPCHQQWQQMKSIANGKYCDQCSKTVVDFSAMDDREVITYLADKQNVCGRFKTTQLQAGGDKGAAIRNRGFLWRGLVGVASLLSITSVIPVHASGKLPGSYADSTQYKKKYVQRKHYSQSPLKKHYPQLPAIAGSNGNLATNKRLTRDTLVLRRVMLRSPIINNYPVKNASVVNVQTAISYTLGGVWISGVAVKEKEVDRELLYELGIR